MTESNNPALDAIAILAKPGKGATLEQFHERILQVAQEVIATQKSGTVTITFKLETVKGADELMVVLAADVTHKMPKRPPETSRLFLGADSMLHHQDTRADELPGIREVVAEKPTPNFVTREDLGPPERRAE